MFQSEELARGSTPSRCSWRKRPTPRKTWAHAASTLTFGNSTISAKAGAESDEPRATDLVGGADFISGSARPEVCPSPSARRLMAIGGAVHDPEIGQGTCPVKSNPIGGDDGGGDRHRSFRWCGR